MEHRHYRSLLRAARRLSRRPDEADDLLHASLLPALENGRNVNVLETHRWLTGVLRRQAALAARGAIRARRREAAWQSARSRHADAPDIKVDAAAALAHLSPAVRIVVLLALRAHPR